MESTTPTKKLDSLDESLPSGHASPGISRSPTVNSNGSESVPSTSLRPSATFFDDTKEMKMARTLYIRIALVGTLMVTAVIFLCLPLYWGALLKFPKPLSGFIVDFDGSLVGSNVSRALQALPVSTIRWEIVPASNYPAGPEDLVTAIREEKAWIGISINPNATQELEAAIENVDTSYDGSSAITAYGAEARQETAYRSFLKPNVQTSLEMINEQFATNFTSQLASRSNFESIVSSAPKILVQPISFTINNIIPFDMPVAIAVTFVGLIYLLILTFFLLNFFLSARMVSGLEQKLSTASLIRVRLGTAAVSYFFLSLFYTLLSLAFQLDMTRKFGHAGFMVLWMINYSGMLGMGLSLESMVTIMTQRFIAFFLLPWVVVNVSVAVLPIETQVNFFRFGYAMPFYNVSRGVRTIVFGTKNELGINFAILLAWAVLSACTLSLFTIFVRWRNHKQLVAQSAQQSMQATPKEA